LKRANLRRKSSTIRKAADNLSKAGFSWGCVSAIDSNGRTIWIADAHRDDGRRLIARADENSLRLWNLNQQSAISPDPHKFLPVSRCGINR
jgi:hypothetical protein